MVKPEILVEIDAGTAFFSIAFLQHTKHSKIYACDVSELMINLIKKNMDEGPPIKIRCFPERVKEQLVNSEFIM